MFVLKVLQGPCVGNQHSLASSRLWDAVSGFLFLFANWQEKLSKDPSQIELLQELLNLQADLITMLLAMLEGCVLNGAISRQMVDTLVESSANMELILNYFNIFLNLPSEDDLALEDGCINPKDFKEKLDLFLMNIPDKPMVVGLTPSPCNMETGRPSNSLLQPSMI